MLPPLPSAANCLIMVNLGKMPTATASGESRPTSQTFSTSLPKISSRPRGLDGGKMRRDREAERRRERNRAVASPRSFSSTTFSFGLNNVTTRA